VKEQNLESHLRRVHGHNSEEAKREAASVLFQEEDANRTIKLAFVTFFVLLMVALFIIFAYQVYLKDGGVDDGGDDKVYETVHIKTEDGWDIYGDYYPPASGNPSMVLVHGFNEDRKAYSSFAMDLYELGYGVFSYDSRGHGDSTYRHGDFASFTQDDVAEMSLDVKRAVTYLEGKGAAEYGVVIIGASAGANSGAIHAVNDTRVTGLVLLSPGEDYMGLRPLDAIKGFHGDILFVAAPGDTYAYSTSLQFKENATLAHTTEFLEGSGSDHGTNTLKDGEVRASVVEWIKDL